MRILYLDAFSGISGDMFLGLALDLGLDLAQLKNELSRLPFEGYRLSAERQLRQGISGTYLSVEAEDDHPHRHWRDIDAMLEASNLHPDDKKLSRRLFSRIAQAEGKIHGIAPEKVHFHEVGAVDSIIDLVGAAVSLRLLGVQKLICSPLPLGRGLVQCAHGSFPLPAPATLELLRGAPVLPDDCDKELVTPTGAAIAAELGSFEAMPAMKLSAVGYGLGTRHLQDRPNVLRGMLGEIDSPAGLETDRISVLETHLDDCPGEWMGALCQQLMEAGALDAAIAPLTMKKGRPGFALTVLCELGREKELAELILRGSSAIGVRFSQSRRFKLNRQCAEIELEGSRIRVKLISLGDEPLRITPEFDDCQRLARTLGRPLPEIYRRVELAAAHLLNLQ